MLITLISYPYQFVESAGDQRKSDKGEDGSGSSSVKIESLP
jgi:hypothetical protein